MRFGILFTVLGVLLAASVALAAQTGTTSLPGTFNGVAGTYHLPFDASATPPTFIAPPPSAFFRPAGGGPDVPLGNEWGPDVIHIDPGGTWHLFRIRAGGTGPQGVYVTWTLDTDRDGVPDPNELSTYQEF